ncbi:dual adapter for phosphotyrosine and 3-phosphotyrosine and 3-phosphoinositide-like isoform X2 [Liolophura sinensis]|uniref:dual adapter for phosphotyrosine and 3-phosphotyrosine and 3-phosphoinositide-like isoform X2 n=1 Tax=Liolophura sinensis TaxID=3198878 RepID=UPI00315873A8
MMSTTYPLSTESFELLDWYHPNADRHVAESLLLHNGVDGTYLLRPSSKRGEYALSVRCNDSVKHFTISVQGNELRFGHGIFSSMADFLHHFANKPLISGESGQLMLLREAYPRQVEEPDEYDTVKVHAEFNIGDETDRKIDFSVNSKEGFLTKLGLHFKTWRSRWFVLQKNELKYFKDKNMKTPIRVLDLNECVECKRDEVSYPSKANVFRLVFDWRTFYFFSPTEQEMEEWIRLINWRLQNRTVPFHPYKPKR